MMQFRFFFFSYLFLPGLARRSTRIGDARLIAEAKLLPVNLAVPVINSRLGHHGNRHLKDVTVAAVRPAALGRRGRPVVMVEETTRKAPLPPYQPFDAIGAATRLPPLHPSFAPLSTLDLGGGRTIHLHIPEDDAIFESVMAEAQSVAMAAGADRFDEVMEECTSAMIGPSFYWAQLWPSSVALSRLITAKPALVRKARVLELGCGLGLCAVSAALAGAASVLATDLQHDALTYAAANAATNRVADTVDVQQLDWSSPAPLPPPLDDAPYGAVLCADVIYDESVPPLLSALLHKVVAHKGRVLLADQSDRPYKQRRRDALLRALFAPEGDFEPEEADAGACSMSAASADNATAATTTRVALQTKQGNEHEITCCVLRRWRVSQ